MVGWSVGWLVGWLVALNGWREEMSEDGFIRISGFQGTPVFTYTISLKHPRTKKLKIKNENSSFLILHGQRVDSKNCTNDNLQKYTPLNAIHKVISKMALQP